MPWHKQLIFYGDAESPLLAPRGVCLHGNLLVVSDTGQNRVFVKLIVADAWNHRVLIWPSIPTVHSQPADVVVGQENFTNTKPNRAGIGADPGADTLYWPYGVWSQNNCLWIADTGNRRVLYFENLPLENGAQADAVIGQPDMHCRDYNPQHAIWPYSVKTNKAGRLLITDTQYYRVLLWQQQEQARHISPHHTLSYIIL